METNYPSVIAVGPQRHEVLVTNRPDVADEWLLSLPISYTCPGKILGVSFSWAALRDPDGFPYERVQSIHFSYLSSVLVVYLGSARLLQFSHVVFAFLRSPENVFVGMDAGAALEDLGVWRAGPNKARVVSLWDAAVLAGINLAVSKRPVGGPMYEAMIDMLLEGVDTDLLMDPDLLRSGSWAWPLSNAQVECAVQTAVLCQNLGLAAFRASERHE